MPSFLNIAAGSAGILSLALVVSALKRRNSPEITCQLSCKCGKIKGYITAKKEDSKIVHCYCADCRNYAAFVAAQGNHPEETVGIYGESRLVQVCKSDIHITQGKEYLQLARKAPPEEKGGAQSMHRYYAKCCHVPMMNTIDFLGFTGVIASVVDDNQDKFDGPYAGQVQEALKTPPKLPPVSVPDFLWKLARYHSSRSKGPFDYDMKPVYWGKSGAVETKKES